MEDLVQNEVLKETKDVNEKTENIKEEPKKRGRKKKEQLSSSNNEELNNLKIEYELQQDLDNFLVKNDIKQELLSKMILPTGLDVLDAVLGGGIPMHFCQLVGNPGCSKSTLAARILAEGQRLYKPKFLAKYFDSEASTSKERLFNLGVMYPSITPYDQEVTVEKIFKSVDAMCKFKADHPELLEIPSIIIWDSIANTLTEKGMLADNPDQVLGEKARVLSQGMPKLVNILNKYNISLVGVNQLRDKIEMGIFKTPNVLRYLASSNIPGGKSLLFNSYQILFLQHVKEVDNYGFKGAIIEVKTVKNKMFTPNLSIKLILSFERGFSNFWSNYEFLKETKRVNAGAWCYLINYPTIKFRQQDAINYYRANQAFRDAWKEALDDAIKKELIEANKSLDMSKIEVYDEEISPISNIPIISTEEISVPSNTEISVPSNTESFEEDLNSLPYLTNGD